MKQRFASGQTLSEIGDYYGISRQRVQQIFKRMQVTRIDGGVHVRTNKIRYLLAQRYEDNSRRKYAISGETRRAIIAEYGFAPFQKFSQHIKHARERHIPFRLTFAEWWNLWIEKWHMRGRAVGQFCMSRHKDQGAYEIGNVSIKTSSDNHIEYQEIRRLRSKRS